MIMLPVMSPAFCVFINVQKLIVRFTSDPLVDKDGEPSQGVIMAICAGGVGHFCGYKPTMHLGHRWKWSIWNNGTSGIDTTYKCSPTLWTRPLSPTTRTLTAASDERPPSCPMQHVHSLAMLFQQSLPLYF